VPRGHSPGAQGEVGDECLAELLVPSEHERHVFGDLGARKRLYGALGEDLMGRLVEFRGCGMGAVLRLEKHC
jgi:hypothetical protein